MSNQPTAPAGAQPAQAQYFTGQAWVKMLAPADNATNCTVGDVLFEPGCALPGSQRQCVAAAGMSSY